MRSIIYNYQGGAGGEGYAAKQHGLPHSIDKVGKVRLQDSKHNLPKELVLSGNFFRGLIELGQGIYLTHHLYLLDDHELKQIEQRFDIISIDASQHLNEIFLLRLFKDFARLREDKLIPMVLSGSIMQFYNAGNRSLIHNLPYPGSIIEKIQRMLEEYSDKRGMFYQDNVHWHDQLQRIPGKKLEYSPKGPLSQIYLHGCYWDLDAILHGMHHE